ncbi:MAG: cell division protein FtsX [Flavobacteriales bacterium]|nr:cell division protein FtsX [Flavobacteriales bacterium]
MQNAEEIYSKRKLKSSGQSTIVSISLVLFMLGCIGLVILISDRLAVFIKENVSMDVYLKDNVKEVNAIELQKGLDTKGFVKSTNFISKDQAIENLKKDLDPDENFVSFLGDYNPLPSSITVNLNAAYANNDSLVWIEKSILENKGVKEVVYQKSMIDMINENVRTISFYLLCFSGLLLLVAIALINNTIRLSIYSKRFIIKTMELVGATHWFIKKPFIYTGVLHGIYGSLIAILMLLGIMFLIQNEIPDLINFRDIELFGSLFGSVLFIGVLISWLSTSFAVSKYLKLRTGELY